MSSRDPKSDIMLVTPCSISGKIIRKMIPDHRSEARRAVVNILRNDHFNDNVRASYLHRLIYTLIIAKWIHFVKCH